MDIAWKNFNKNLSLNALLAIWAWKVEGFIWVQKFWLNPAVWNTFETIWDLWGAYNWIQSASKLSISSTSNNDTQLWTGARRIKITWLDSEYNIIDEEINLNWSVAVETTKLFYRIDKLMVLSAWSLQKAEGVISAKINWITHAQIVDWNNQSLMGIYTIPKWYTGLILQGKASCWKGKEVEMNFRGRPQGGVFNLYHSFYIYENSYGYDFSLPLPIPEKTDILVEAKSDIETKVSAVFDILLIKN